MQDDPLTLVDVALQDALDRVVETGLDGAVDTTALAQYERLLEERIELTEPSLDMTA